MTIVTILIVLLYFIFTIRGTSVKNVLEDIGLYAEVAADVVNSMTSCEFHCPCG